MNRIEIVKNDLYEEWHSTGHILRHRINNSDFDDDTANALFNALNLECPDVFEMMNYTYLSCLKDHSGNYGITDGQFEVLINLKDILGYELVII